MLVWYVLALSMDGLTTELYLQAISILSKHEQKSQVRQIKLDRHKYTGMLFYMEDTARILSKEP